MTPRRWLSVALGIIALLGGLASGVRYFRAHAPASGVIAQVSRPRISGDFSLVAGDGRAWAWSRTHGQPRLVFFGFTHCPEACPVTLANVASALQAMGPRGAAIEVLFITVDPERDTPAAMSGFVRTFGPQFHGLTGTPAQIAAAARAFGVFYEKAPAGTGGPDYMINHTATLFIVGADEELLGMVPYGTASADTTSAISASLGL
jgi:protein SCO1/2